MRNPMRRLVTVLIITLFLIVPGSGAVMSTKMKPMFSTLQDVTLRDDAFHGPGKLPNAEWWYFDAVFDNGYSMTLGVRVFSVFGRGDVNTRLDIYHQGTPVVESKKTSSMKELYASTEIPLVVVAGKELILGSFDPVSGRFSYNVSYEASQGAVSLHFVGCTQGWKRQQQAGDWWAVVLPCATVTGTITIGGTSMNVTGTGYHDHNWDVHPLIALNYGWFWGTFESADYSVTWAMVYPTRLTRHSMMVVNEKDGGYLDIPPKTIWFSTKQARLDHFRLIPMFLNTETMTGKVFLTVNMRVTSVDHARFLGVIQYWRFHVNCTGTIMMNGHMETVNGVFIAEYLRFR